MPRQYIVMLGPPGSGKGTQAASLAAELNLPHISSGDLLRCERALKTPLGLRLATYVDRGELVPDDLITELVLAYLDSSVLADGGILDGFPRSIPQAVALDHVLAQRGARVSGALWLAVPTDELVRRAAGRRVCPHCRATYHLQANPPRRAGVCDTCGAQLTQRTDDHPDVVSQRLAVYHAQTEPLLAYFHGRGLLHRIDGNQPIDSVRDSVRAAARALRPTPKGRPMTTPQGVLSRSGQHDTRCERTTEVTSDVQG